MQLVSSTYLNMLLLNSSIPHANIIVKLTTLSILEGDLFWNQSKNVAHKAWDVGLWNCSIIGKLVDDWSGMYM